MSIWKWDAWIDGPDDSSLVTLGEGGTPLLLSRGVGPRSGLHSLRFKMESGNPAGSYKDRFAASAVSHMVAEGKKRCIATSSGNAGAALAAYCAAAGIECFVAVVEGAPTSKLRQMMAYGAKIFRVREFGVSARVTSAVIDELFKLGERDDTQVQISAYKYSPKGMRGVETMAFEIADVFPNVQHVFCPAGGGGLCLAMARGFKLFGREERLQAPPKVHCVQPEGNNTIAGPLRNGDREAQAIDATTQISGLQVAKVVDGNEVLTECRKTGGTGYLVADEEVWNVQRRLAREEGLFVEPAAAVSVAGALQARAKGEIGPGEHVVCLVTGTGFKDEKSVEQMTAGAECPTIDVSEIGAVVTGSAS